jgi:aquaporin Z
MLIVKLATELIGTFVFLAVILAAPGNPIAISLALLTAIYFGGQMSGGHFNPAVSAVMFANGKMNGLTSVAYVAAQITGGLLALAWWRLSASTRSQLLASSK